MQLLVRVPHMHGFVVTSLAFVIAKNTSTSKGRATPKPLQEVLLSISADKSCCATTTVYNTGNVEVVYEIYMVKGIPIKALKNYQNLIFVGP